MSLDISLVDSYTGVELYSCNITHNLTEMALHAGIYYYIWRPEEFGVHRAGDIVGPLSYGLHLLKSDPYYFKQFNPKNGWGSYESFVDFVTEYRNKCVQFSYANIEVSR